MLFNIDVNDFGPFHAEVWGSVSDWVMVVVTGITAYFLYHTLKSQNKTLDSQQASISIQNNALTLEQKKYIASIQPFFSANYLDSSETVVSFSCRFRNGLARQAVITNKNINGHFSYSEGEVLYNVYVGHRIGNMLPDDEFVLSYNLVPGQNEYHIRFYIKYYDATGENGYIQQIGYLHSKKKFAYGEIKEYVHDKTILPNDFEIIQF